MTAQRPLAERLSLIVVTDPECGPGRAVVDVVRAALQGGAPAIQLRDKSADARDLVLLARLLLEETRRAGALLFVNDRVDVALAAGADGAHLGDDDLPLPDARRIAPPGFLLGRSVDDLDQARAATAEGADYLGIGPVRDTPSKEDAGAALGVGGVARVCAAVDLPVVAIGGVDAETAPALSAAGAAGIAVIRAVMAAADPRRATEELLREFRRGLRGDLSS